MRHMRRTAAAAVVTLAALGVAGTAAAERESFPHAFHNNMGYCAPFLAQLNLPNGDAVRPWINQLLRDLTAGDASFEGQKNVGDLYSDRARSETDTQCLPR